MTLEATHPIGSRTPEQRDGRAIVIGGGMAGLLAAGTLAAWYESVLVLERDSLAQPSERRGVPQAAQPHLLLTGGRTVIEELCPGFTAAVRDAGGLQLAWHRDLHWYHGSERIQPTDSLDPLLAVSRSTLERTVREFIAARPSVEIKDGTAVTGYAVSQDGSDIAGVECADGDRITADLVVDTSGRTSRTPSWIEPVTGTIPTTTEITVDVEYATVVIDRPSTDRRLVFQPPTAPRTRGAGAFPIEGDRRLVTFQGIHGTKPPTDRDSVTRFTDALPDHSIHEIVQGESWDEEHVARYPFPASRWHRYDRLDRWPNSLVVLGDAVASFNPIYGQGISVAALSVRALDTALADAVTGPVASGLQSEIASIVREAWRVSAGSDVSFLQTDQQPSLGIKLLEPHIDRLLTVAVRDPLVASAFVRVAMMQRPVRSLFAPTLLWRIYRPSIG